MRLWNAETLRAIGCANLDRGTTVSPVKLRLCQLRVLETGAMFRYATRQTNPEAGRLWYGVSSRWLIARFLFEQGHAQATQLEVRLETEEMASLW